MTDIEVANFKIEQLEKRLKFLESLVEHGICKTCGGVSWDIPLADYCRCEKKRKQAQANDEIWLKPDRTNPSPQ